MTTEITQEQAIALVASYRTDIDRYRDRARSVATLLATASGALAAGLVFSEIGQSFPIATKATGYGGIAVLAISVCFFLSASMYSLEDAEESEETADAPSVRGFLDAAEQNTGALVEAIRRRTKWGKRLSVSALCLLLAMVPLSIAFPAERLNVVVQLLEPIPAIRGCPADLIRVEGSVSSTDLSGNSELIPIKVTGEPCGSQAPGQPATIYLQRSKVLIAEIRIP